MTLKVHIEHSITFLQSTVCVRLQNSRFFLKISKEIGKACRKSLTRAKRDLASLPSLALCFQPRSRPFVWLLARTWIRKTTDCFAVYVCAKNRYIYKGVGLIPPAGKEMLCQGSKNREHLTDNLYLVEGMYPLLWQSSIGDSPRKQSLGLHYLRDTTEYIRALLAQKGFTLNIVSRFITGRSPTYLKDCFWLAGKTIGIVT